jgi:hypothetical protein
MEAQSGNRFRLIEIRKVDEPLNDDQVPPPPSDATTTATTDKKVDNSAKCGRESNPARCDPNTGRPMWLLPFHTFKKEEIIKRNILHIYGGHPRPHGGFKGGGSDPLI